MRLMRPADILNALCFAYAVDTLLPVVAKNSARLDSNQRPRDLCPTL